MISDTADNEASTPSSKPAQDNLTSSENIEEEKKEAACEMETSEELPFENSEFKTKSDSTIIKSEDEQSK